MATRHMLAQRDAWPCQRGAARREIPYGSQSEGGVAADTHTHTPRVTSAFVTVYNGVFDITAPFKAPSPLIATQAEICLGRVFNCVTEFTTAESFK